MTTALHPPQLGPAQSPYPPPPPMAAGPSRLVIGAAVVSLVASLGAVTVAGISWAVAHSGSTHAATTAAPAPDAGQVAAARTKACQLWSTSANAMDNATNAVAHAPTDWNAPATQEALATEARVISVESEYLLRQLPADTPAEIRSGIGDYVTASFDMENATAHRKGTARDAAINRANEAESKVATACR
jgi:hypothetical protein